MAVSPFHADRERGCVEDEVGKRFSLTSHIPTRPHTMDEGGDGRLPQEVPSVALDQLFLEIHDHLPRDARGKLAQLADEVKKLTEANTAGALETQPSSTEHAVVRREKGTIEAKPSSGQPVARGEVMHVVGCPIEYKVFDRITGFPNRMGLAS